MRDLVKKAVILEKRDWLEKLKTLSRKEGQVKLQAMMARQARWKTRAAKASQKTQSDGPSGLTTVLHLILDEEEEGQLAEFQKSYAEDRRLMANIITETPINLSTNRVHSFEILLQDIVGFFEVEHTILVTTNHFRFPSDVMDDVSRGLGEANAEGTLPTIKVWIEAFIQITE
ncbi:Rab GTPase-binding exocyst subunit S15, partial [Massospora cicadina]